MVLKSRDVRSKNVSVVSDQKPTSLNPIVEENGEDGSASGAKGSGS